MCWFDRIRVALSVFILCALGGCSSSSTSGVKEELTEQEKQQVIELNKQRQEEWKKR